jgi:16S rRNA (adenine1518-N6/adenine1519-N6)-dimethyltransferase
MKMIEYAKLRQMDTVLEVGAGIGHLTKFLCKNVAKVYAIEVDPRLVKVLQDRFNETENVDIIYGDILKVKIPQFNKIVCNPPYSISSPLIFKLLQNSFEIGIMTLQKDFAKRLVAKEGNKEYGRLTVMASLKANIKVLDYVPPEAFYPIPEVESAIVEIVPLNREDSVLNWTNFSEFIRIVFNQRNKKLRNGLISFLKNRYSIDEEKIEEILEKLPHLEERVYKLNPESLSSLFNKINQTLAIIEDRKCL